PREIMDCHDSPDNRGPRTFAGLTVSRDISTNRLLRAFRQRNFNEIPNFPTKNI
ncbi:hypothetical protein WH47_02356, partial [Habropoda laboriosa]